MKNICFLFFMICNMQGYAQQFIRGIILDSTNNEPLSYAVIRQGSKGPVVSSNQQGYFQLFPSGNADSCTVSLIGYQEQSFHASGLTGIQTIRMKRGSVNMGEVIITAQSNNSTFHTLSALDLHLRPVNSAQDLMRLVPGLFLGQHHGGGVAEHIFLRGFDADHGTDVNVSVDDMPVNLVSHAHGQGFSDLHFLIPELVNNYSFGKGPYYADHGDFTTAGYVAFHTANELEKSTVKLEAGQFQTGRALAMINLLNANARQKGETAYIAGEAAYTNGPFNWPQHFNRLNLFGKFGLNLTAKEKLMITLSTFSSQWRSSGEIPERAVEQGLIGRFGYLDSLQGGATNRSNIIVRLQSALSNNWFMQNQFYYSKYHFSHRYNDTFFAEDSINGDRLRQQEFRNIFGYNGKLSHHGYLKNNIDLVSTFGLGFQSNQIQNSELSHIDNQFRVIEYLQLGNINENIYNSFLEESIRKGKWFLNAGLRADYLYFNYADHLNPSMPARSEVVFSPKVNLEYTLNSTVQFYLKAGKGFHSNDAKVVVARQGQEILPAAYGVDFGMNWKPAAHLYITTAVWWLRLQQEFIYDGDEGTLEPSGKTRREGIDLSVRYQFSQWLYAFLDLNYSNARDIQEPKGSNYIPLAVPFSSAGGLNYTFHGGINGGLSYRYMTDRPANADNSLKARGYFVTDLTAFYTKRKFEFGFEIQNLLNTKWREEQFEVESKMKNETGPVEDMNFTAGTPLFVKLEFALFF